MAVLTRSRWCAFPARKLVLRTSVDQNSEGITSIRFEGIDMLETHFDVGGDLEDLPEHAIARWPDARSRRGQEWEENMIQIERLALIAARSTRRAIAGAAEAETMSRRGVGYAH